MENLGPKLNRQSKRNPPPKRGQVKLRIIKSLISSVAAIGGCRRSKNGGSPSPIAYPTPATTPSGYTSDGQSDAVTEPDRLSNSGDDAVVVHL